MQRNNSKNISFGNFRQSTILVESGKKKSEISSNKNQDLSFGNLDNESLDHISVDSAQLKFDSKLMFSQL
jgi:hypothetical protein